MKLFKKITGFTLTELVVTTAIMGTLAAVAVPSFIETNLKAKSEKTMANLSDIGSAIGQKYNELASSYGSIAVFPNETSAGSSLIKNDVALQAWNGSGATYNSSDGVELLVSDVVPNLPLSPFDDKQYVVKLTQQAAVEYANTDGNLTVTVTKAKVNYSDPENTQMSINFEY